MDINLLIAEAEKDGIQFRNGGDSVHIRVPNDKEYWSEKLLPLKPEIHAFLYGGEPANGGVNGSNFEPEPRIEQYQPFPTHTLPDVLSRFTTACSESLVCDESFIVMPMLCSLASSVGATRMLSITDTWIEACVLWGAVVSTSGSQKSPAQELAVAPLEDAQAFHIEQEPELRRQYEADKKLYEMDFREWNKKGRSNGQPQPEEPIPPLTVRYVCDNTTIESLAGRLQDNPRGLLVAADELSAWLGSMGRYANGATQGEKAQWMSFYRAGRLLHDRGRKDGETTYVKRAAVSICGGVPPRTFRKMLAGDDMENGMAARLLIAMPPKQAKRWSTSPVSRDVKAEYTRIFSRLLALGFDDGAPVLLRLTPEAEKIASMFVNRHGKEQVDLDDALQSAWSKLEAVAFRLALLFSLVRWAKGDDPAEQTGDVTVEDMTAGIELTEWFCNEWKRFFTTFSETDEELERRKLVDWIIAKGGRVTTQRLREAKRRYRRAGAAQEALEGLVKAGFARREVNSTGGRQRTDYVILG